MQVNIKHKRTTKQKDGDRLIAFEKASIMHDGLAGKIDKTTLRREMRKKTRLEKKLSKVF